MHQLLSPEGRLLSQGMESGICDGRSGTGQISLQVLQSSPLRITLPNARRIHDIHWVNNITTSVKVKPSLHTTLRRIEKVEV